MIDVEKQINELMTMEYLLDQAKRVCCKARVQLERFHAPAPSGVKRGRPKKQVLSQEQQVKLVAGFRKKLLKKKHA